jgi:integrase
MITPELNRPTDSQVLTLFNTLTIESRVCSFKEWLKETGASDVTIQNYTRAVVRWSLVLEENKSLRPAEVWRQSHTTRAMKRMTGYACRRWSEFCRSVFDETADFGVPSRLPSGSTPNPRPVTNDEFRRLLLAAKQILPRRTSYSFRAWLHFCEQTGVRRTESDIDWNSVDWLEGAIVVRGKTGQRQLPLGRMRRLLGWLVRKNPAFPWVGCRGQRLSPSVLYNLFKRVASHAGLAALHPHRLRHRRLTALCHNHLGANPLLVLSYAGSRHVSSLAPYYAVTLSEKAELLRASSCH